MGCTQYLVMLATKPEYNKKVVTTIIVIPTIFNIVFCRHNYHNNRSVSHPQVKLGFLLAPAAFMSHSPNIIFQISSLADDIEVGLLSSKSSELCEI